VNNELNELVDKIMLERLKRNLARVPPDNSQEFNEGMVILLGACRTAFEQPIDSFPGLCCAVQAMASVLAGADTRLGAKIIDVFCDGLKATWKRDGDAYGEAVRQLAAMQEMDENASRH
jgi:hypothetical protein